MMNKIYKHLRYCINERFCVRESEKSKMTSKDKWNRIVEYYNKYLNSPEQTIQSVWESIFAELLGYSRLEGEIERHRKIPIGSTERVISDIIISDGNTDLFVVELKQHNLPISNGMELQLLSYLKQLRNNTGLLICNKIYIFDYDYSKRDDEQNRAIIEFKQDNPDGIKFIDLFSKATYEKSAIKEFIKHKVESIMNIKLIRKELSPNLVLNLLRAYFADKYSEAEFEQAIKEYNIP